VGSLSISRLGGWRCCSELSASCKHQSSPKRQPHANRSDYARSEYGADQSGAGRGPAGSGNSGAGDDDPIAEAEALPDLPPTWVPELSVPRDQFDMRCPRVSRKRWEEVAWWRLL